MDIIDVTKDYLEGAGLSQAELARLIGVHPTSLNRCLQRKFDPGVIGRLTSFLMRKHVLVQRSATQCNAPQRSATQCNAPQRSATQ